MKLIFRLLIILFLMNTFTLYAQNQFEADTFDVSDGKLTIYFIGHGTLMFDYNNLIIHVDPVRKYADYSKIPKADIILITHKHPDHLDKKAISVVSKEDTTIILNKDSYDILKRGTIMNNGDSRIEKGIKIEAVPAYNTTKDRDKFHPNGRDNGYIITTGNKAIYIAGDTEDIPEIKNLKNIDIAFLPMNQPYTMTPEQVANAARMFKPKILYPYHYGNTDVTAISDLMKGVDSVELRIRPLK
ncbi:MAG: MBL fold metallo-hydrolase [Spirochaetes bacterium]|nr:MBL fold metallo-hydrolase [Spirochaetota bacterium]